MDQRHTLFQLVRLPSSATVAEVTKAYGMRVETLWMLNAGSDPTGHLPPLELTDRAHFYKSLPLQDGAAPAPEPASAAPEPDPAQAPPAPSQKSNKKRCDTCILARAHFAHDRDRQESRASEPKSPEATKSGHVIQQGQAHWSAASNWRRSSARRRATDHCVEGLCLGRGGKREQDSSACRKHGPCREQARDQ